MRDLEAYLEQKRRRVDEALDRLLPAETERPAGLHKAMRYSIFCGGKRFRPILCIAAAETLGGSEQKAMIPAVALECLHTYTLIHDDLPAMDNDDLRRGRPTSHKVFGEANAILAGDALLTLAFELLAGLEADDPSGCLLALELARAAGSRGVAGGQFEDLAGEGKEPDAEGVRYIHVHKTALLIRAACRMGAIAAGAAEADLEILGRYGESIGLAFQVADDILNVTSTPEELGKAAGSDAARCKMTYVAVHGLDGARREAEKLVAEALAALEPLSRPAPVLEALARYVIERRQ